MRLLLLNQFYPPDPAPTGHYLHDLARALVERGHEVKVLCSRRSYDGTDVYPNYEVMSGVQVHRLWATGFGRRKFLGKLSDYASFYGSLLIGLLRESKRMDLILSLTTPPYIGLLGKLAARIRGCNHARWVMDLYPDVIYAHGMARKNGMFFSLLESLARFQLRGTLVAIALGPTMAQRLAHYTDNETGRSRVKWLPLWSDAGLSPWPASQPIPLREERDWQPEETVLLYSGNMGLGHRFTEFLEASRRLGKGGPRWVFCGGGKRRVEIEEFARSHPVVRVEMLDYAPKEQLREHLCAADVHLMSMDSAWQGLMVPSKLQASFAVGRPVLYVGGRDCETAKWIQESGGGWVVDQDDLTGLLAAIQQAQDPVERQARGRAAYQFALQHFDKSAICLQLAVMLESGLPTGEPAREHVALSAPHPGGKSGLSPSNACDTSATLPLR